MRVLQLIDSLDAGGAERIAVTFANALSAQPDASHLCVTRSEGVLKQQLLNEVGYVFVRKSNTLDLKAAIRLKKYLKEHRIGIIHAHTTSYFFASLVKMLYPKVQLIWHAHLGYRAQTSRWKNKALFICSHFFTSIITVNEALETWCKKKLAVKDVHYLPNFVDTSRFQHSEEELREKSIICLANLKAPKNHLNLVQAFHQISMKFRDWKLLLAGREFNDSYSEKLRETVNKIGLQNKVVFLGQQSEVETLLTRSRIGVLASDSEGLPMALLEYGAAGLAVVSTDVGQCASVISDYGKLVPANDPKTLSIALSEYMNNEEKRRSDALAYQQHIIKHYAATAVMPQLTKIYNGATH